MSHLAVKIRERSNRVYRPATINLSTNMNSFSRGHFLVRSGGIWLWQVKCLGFCLSKPRKQKALFVRVIEHTESIEFASPARRSHCTVLWGTQLWLLLVVIVTPRIQPTGGSIGSLRRGRAVKHPRSHKVNSPHTDLSCVFSTSKRRKWSRWNRKRDPGGAAPLTAAKCSRLWRSGRTEKAARRRRNPGARRSAPPALKASSPPGSATTCRSSRSRRSSSTVEPPTTWAKPNPNHQLWLNWNPRNRLKTIISTIPSIRRIKRRTFNRKFHLGG